MRAGDGAGRGRFGLDRFAVGAAALFTLCNAFEPLAIDDPVYVALATQIRAEPADPYGFAILWRDVPEPAMQLLAPPVLSYWLAPALALFGDRPVLWKLWLFPFALILAGALQSLLRRFAPGLERPLLVLTLFSPALLPHFNLMLDVPATALALLALALFLRACDRDDRAAAALAGLCGGVAAQTKYSAAVAVAALLAWALIARRPRLGVLATAAAVAVFSAWETYLIGVYGMSHFVLATLHGQGTVAAHTPLALAFGLISILGGLAPAVALLAWCGLGASPRALALGALATAVAFAAIAALPAQPVAALQFDPGFDARRPEMFVLFPLGLGVAAAGLATVARLLRAPPGPARAGRFLAVWVALELLGAWWMTPFLASRRLIGLVVALTLAAGHVAAHRRAPGVARAVRGIAAFGAALGLLFQIADLSDGWARWHAVARIESALRELGADPGRETVWVAGHWGYRFYTERRGMRQMIAGRSRLRPGDWVIDAKHVARQRLPAIGGLSPPLAAFEARSPWPWSTLPSLYAGPLPIRRQPRAQLQVSIRRVVEGSVLAPLAPFSRREPRPLGYD